MSEPRKHLHRQGPALAGLLFGLFTSTTALAELKVETPTQESFIAPPFANSSASQDSDELTSEGISDSELEALLQVGNDLPPAGDATSVDSRSSEPSEAQAPQANAVPKNLLDNVSVAPKKKAKAFHITTPITWTQLHRLQALYAPEGVVHLRHRQLEGEDGQHGRIGVRWPIRESHDMSFLAESSHYQGDNQRGKASLYTSSLRLHWKHGDQNWLGAIETGHATRLGGKLAWERSLKPGAGISLQVSSQSQKENLLSLQHGEIIDQAALGWSFQLPSELFFTGEYSPFHSRLVRRDQVDGDGQRLTLNLGFNLASQDGHTMGWQFYTNDLVYRDQLRQYLQVKFTQGFEWFDAGQDYLVYMPRTSKARGQTLYGTYGHPFSQHLGWESTVYFGQDLERQLKVGKIRGLQSRLLWVPTHVSRFELHFNTSTESTGVVKGTVYELQSSCHINF